MPAVESSLLLAYYGDDFTGSTDALDWLGRAGVRTVLFFAPPEPAQLRRYPHAQAVGIAGRTRSLAPAAMAAELQPAFQALRALSPRHVHYKVCSTFDSSPQVGSIGRALEEAWTVFQPEFIPLVVGAPALGRYCVFGNLFARMGIGSQGAIHRLDRHPSMSRHPVTPADESDLRLHLARQTARRIGLLDVLQLDRPLEETQAALCALIRSGDEIVLCDALTPEHLARIGALLEHHVRPGRVLFSAGSSAIESALVGHWTRTGQLPAAPTWPTLAPVDRLLVVSGSCSPVTARQIEWARTHDFAVVALTRTAVTAPDAGHPERRGAVALAVAHLQAGRSVVVTTTALGEDATLREAAPAVGAALAQVAEAAVEQAGLRRLVIAGGDTSSYVARALGLEALEMIAPFAAGAPFCRATAAGRAVDGLELNVKGGQVGAEDYFGAAARGRLEP